MAALCYPPLPAGVRLLLHRARLAWASDRGPLMRAAAELRFVRVLADIVIPKSASTHTTTVILAFDNIAYLLVFVLQAFTIRLHRRRLIDERDDERHPPFRSTFGSRHL